MSSYKKYLSQVSYSIKYKGKLDKILLPLLKQGAEITEADVQSLWQQLVAFPVPLLVVQRLDPFWNRLLLKQDKHLAKAFLLGFNEFKRQCNAEKVIQKKFDEYQQSFNDYF